MIETGSKSPQGPSEPPKGEPRDEAPRGFRVSDRRFWVEDDERAAGARSSPPSAGEELRAEYPTFVEQLRAELAEKERQLREYIAAYKEAVGKGLEDVKARLQRESSKELERARERLIEELLEVADNLERSLAAAGGATGPEAFAGLVAGIERVHAQFLGKLEGLGVRRIDTIGASFDPHLHEAIGTASGEHDRIVYEARAGYRIGDRVLRPAQVLVGRTV